MLTTPLPTVWADESSSTGENLLDPAQPVYSVGAVMLDTAVAADLVSAVGSTMPSTSGELKFSMLSNSARGRRGLLTALSRLPADSARAYVAHKRFMVAAKMIDSLVEQLAYDSGYNMYADGAAPGLANLLHLVGPVLGDAAAYEQMLVAFVQAVRHKATLTIDGLFAAIDSYLATCDRRWAETVALLPAARSQAEDLVRLVQSKGVRDGLDPAVPCLVALCSDLGQRLGPFKLVHDESNVVARHALTLLNLEEVPDPVRPTRKLDSLPTVSIEFSDSTAAPQLLIADWVAGTARHVCTGYAQGQLDTFADQLEQLVRPWLAGGLWPDEDAIREPRRLRDC